MFLTRLLGIALGLVLPSQLYAATVQLQPSKDNMLIQQASPSQQRSNGLGDLLVGRTNQDGQGPAISSIRRGLVEFDIAGQVPAGAIITEVVFTVRDVQGLNGDPTVSLHRLLADWGEGSSLQNGGQGAVATAGDATWLYTFFNALNPAASATWATPGGDFAPIASGSAVISDDLGGGQLFSWSSQSYPQMVADVQSWLDQPATNFGWILIGDESRGQTSKRLVSREGSSPPSLQVTYTVVPEASSLVFIGTTAIWAAFFWARATKSVH